MTRTNPRNNHKCPIRAFDYNVIGQYLIILGLGRALRDSGFGICGFFLLVPIRNRKAETVLRNGPF